MTGLLRGSAAPVQARPEPSGALHVLAILVAELGDHHLFLLVYPDQGENDERNPSQADEPVGREQVGDDGGEDAAGVHRMTYPAVRPLGDEFMIRANAEVGTEVLA